MPGFVPEGMIDAVVAVSGIGGGCGNVGRKGAGGSGGNVSCRKEAGRSGGFVDGGAGAWGGGGVNSAGCEDGATGDAGELVPAVTGLPTLLLLSLIRLSQDARIVSASDSRLSGGRSM